MPNLLGQLMLMLLKPSGGENFVVGSILSLMVKWSTDRLQQDHGGLNQGHSASYGAMMIAIGLFPRGPAELLQVSWLEVTSIMPSSEDNIVAGKKYAISFRLQMKQGAFGWNGCSVCLMCKIGQGGKYTAKKIKLVDQPETDEEFETEKLEVTVPADANDMRLYFGLYEVWSGRWKGGLLIHGARVEEQV
ncbi:unnamed protein product [Linum tenue]|uniref:Uncharacterized protein n=1 Tax=Linum tenue TaxID=586396 RepID=A0AAV0LTA9_9ROSI|nr:unnamed protein product [Linum tenue]